MDIANRILVLAKKSMLAQFQSELWNRFGIPLVRLDSIGIAKLRLRIPANKNPFEVYHRIIISIDTLKDVGSYRHFLENTHWDCVVIDEAHNVAGASVPERHLSYRLARLLSRTTNSMLLTTATPHNGKRETFGRLISLLDPSAIPDPEFREYTPEDIKGFFLMRFKEDVRADAGDSLTDRMVVPSSSTTIDATPAEEKVYSALGELRKAAIDARNRGNDWSRQPLLEYGIYKQFLSSPESCAKTVGKRIQKLIASRQDSPELPYLSRIAEGCRSLTIRDASRYKLLKTQLEAIGWNGSPQSPRVLIFTEYRETQDALAKAIAKDFRLTFSDDFEAQAKQAVATIHGSFPDIHLMKTVEAFGTGTSPVRMLLATDVASEGINLHHECHHIVHYDLPWSIITLIQRNGRIDRIGQKHSPVLRYLMVKTRQGLLAGDQSIFDRLIEKVEEINKSTRQGESVLKLYDPEAEERYIAEAGLLPGNANVLEKPAVSASAEATDLEALITQATPGHDEDLLAFLLGEADAPARLSRGIVGCPTPSRQRRSSGDKEFLLEGYRFLAEKHGDYQPIEEAGNLMLLTAPKDLKRRLGSPDESGDVVFGATAIPLEAWPDTNQFRLTHDPDQVELAIKAARHTSGYWSRELLCTDQHPILQWITERLLMTLKREQLLCTDQHPILQWITERLLMTLKRDECPLVFARKLQPGELCFCFIGQVSSKAGVPLIVDAHAISFRKGGGFQHRSLREALEAADFTRLINDGRTGNVKAAQPLIASAVEASLAHMKVLGDRRYEELLPLLRAEERRLRKWRERRRDLLETRIEKLGREHPRARKYQKDLDEIDAYLRDREQNWREARFTAASEPSTRLVLVIEGVS